MLAQTYKDAGSFLQHIHVIEVCIDQHALTSGTAKCFRYIPRQEGGQHEFE